MKDVYLGRLAVLAAAILWSTSGAWVKSLNMAAEPLSAYRALFAGIFLISLVGIGRKPIKWSPMMLGMIACFAGMNYTFISAMTYTSAANTIVLQYTCILWMLLGSVFWLREPLERSSLVAVLGGLVGVAILIAGQWSDAGASHRLGMMLGLGSGVLYAGVALFLRRLREFDPFWIAALNHLSAAAILGTGVAMAIASGTLPLEAAIPTGSSWLLLAFFGVTQMGLPYLLFAVGLRKISPQEAGILTLIEPVLNPLWTFLVVDEVPSVYTVVGGTILIGMLFVRYLPKRRRAEGTTETLVGSVNEENPNSIGQASGPVAVDIPDLELSKPDNAAALRDSVPPLPA